MHLAHGGLFHCIPEYIKFHSKYIESVKLSVAHSGMYIKCWVRYGVGSNTYFSQFSVSPQYNQPREET